MEHTPLVLLKLRAAPFAVLLQNHAGFALALAQRALGLLAGLARETASRTLSKLRSRGTVEERGLSAAGGSPTAGEARAVAGLSGSGTSGRGSPS